MCMHLIPFIAINPGIGTTVDVAFSFVSGNLRIRLIKLKQIPPSHDPVRYHTIGGESGLRRLGRIHVAAAFGLVPGGGSWAVHASARTSTSVRRLASVHPYFMTARLDQNKLGDEDIIFSRFPELKFQEWSNIQNPNFMHIIIIIFILLFNHESLRYRRRHRSLWCLCHFGICTRSYFF